MILPLRGSGWSFQALGNEGAVQAFFKEVLPDMLELDCALLAAEGQVRFAANLH